MVALATRVNLVFVKWLDVKENHFWPSVEEKTQIVWLYLRLKTLLLVSGVRTAATWRM